MTTAMNAFWEQDKENKDLRERNARLVAALERIADSCCAETGCGCRECVKGYVRAAITENKK